MLNRAAGFWILLCAVAVAQETNPKLRWSAKVSGIQQGSAAVSDGQIFAPVIQESAVVSLDAASGKVLWRQTLADTSPFSPILDKDSVYVITGSCTLYRLARADGKVLWSRWLAASIESMPTLSGGKIFAASSDTSFRWARAGGWHLVCLDAATGKELWARKIGTDVAGAPLVMNGQAFVCSKNGVLRAFDVEKGKALWVQDAHAQSMPVPCRDWLVYKSATGLKAVTRMDGKAAWSWDRANGDSRPREAHDFRLPMIAGDRAFVTLSETDLACVNLMDRSTVWTWSGGEEAPGEPVMVGGRVYFGTSKGTVLGLNAVTGRKLWEIKTEAAIADAPAIMDGSIYFHDRQGGLVCVDAGTPEATGWGMWGGSPTHAGPILSANPPNVVTPSAADGVR
ncbi:MAG: PQQ repeat protein / protein kinase domain [Planctomycetota bacterium]|nr:MAG: PQQ repeat protein / protein kinase domain [Planctomycetota bacterium]